LQFDRCYCVNDKASQPSQRLSSLKEESPLIMVQLMQFGLCFNCITPLLNNKDILNINIYQIVPQWEVIYGRDRFFAWRFRMTWFSIHQVPYTFIHHSVTPECRNKPDCSKKLRAIQIDHIHSRSWCDIGYRCVSRLAS
jgi:hypothetical protein